MYYEFLSLSFYTYIYIYICVFSGAPSQQILWGLDPLWDPDQGRQWPRSTQHMVHLAQSCPAGTIFDQIQATWRKFVQFWPRSIPNEVYLVQRWPRFRNTEKRRKTSGCSFVYILWRCQFWIHLRTVSPNFGLLDPECLKMPPDNFKIASSWLTLANSGLSWPQVGSSRAQAPGWVQVGWGWGQFSPLPEPKCSRNSRGTKTISDRFKGWLKVISGVSQSSSSLPARPENMIKFVIRLVIKVAIDPTLFEIHFTSDQL